MRAQSVMDIIAGKNNKEAFNEEKALAVLTYLLKLLGGKGDKHQLVKMMYWMERKSLIETGFPLFFDQVFSLPYGPILSQTLDNINTSNIETAPWYGYVRLGRNRRDVTLINDGDFEELSESDESLIKETVEKFRGMSFSETTAFFHDLPEYTKVSEGSREEISYRVMLESETSACEEDISFALLEIESAKLER